MQSTINVKARLNEKDTQSEMWQQYNLEVSVVDSGPGISENTLKTIESQSENLLTPEKYNDSSGKSCFGLSFCKMMCQSHDGDLIVTHPSLSLHGSNFTLQFSMIKKQMNTENDR